MVFGRLGPNVSKLSIKIQTSSHKESQNFSIVLCTVYMDMYNFNTVSDLQTTPNDGPVDSYSFCWDNVRASFESKHQGFHKNKFWWWPWRSMLTLNVPVPYKYGIHQCVEPWFHALEPHYPRAPHSRPAHSSHGSEASTQLALPRKPRFRAFPRICGPQFRAFPCNWKPQLRAFPRNFDDSTSHAFPRIPV